MNTTTTASSTSATPTFSAAEDSRCAYRFPNGRRWPMLGDKRVALGVSLAAVVALAVVVLGAGYFGRSPSRSKSAPPAAKVIRLAVLPFANLSGDPSREYFSDGITEAHAYLGRTYEMEGNYELALKEFEQADFDPWSIGDREAGLGRVYARMGRRQDALRIVAELQSVAKKRPALPYNIATIYAALGDRDETFHYLDEDFRQLGWFHIFPIDPEFDQVRSDPRYSLFVARVRDSRLKPLKGSVPLYDRNPRARVSR